MDTHLRRSPNNGVRMF